TGVQNHSELRASVALRISPKLLNSLRWKGGTSCDAVLLHRYFSHEDVKTMLAFYGTPAGRAATRAYTLRGGTHERHSDDRSSANGSRSHRRPAVGDAALARPVEQDALPSTARACDRAQCRPRALRARLAPSAAQAQFRAGLVHPRGRISDRRGHVRPG